jgi:hypothetical protein
MLRLILLLHDYNLLKENYMCDKCSKEARLEGFMWIIMLAFILALAWIFGK